MEATLTNAEGAVISWDSSDDSVATITAVNNHPRFQAIIDVIGPGSATITGSITVDGVEYSDSVEINAVPSITVSLDNDTIAVGGTAAATGTSNPPGYTLTNMTFSSTHEEVATVDASTGVISGIAEGLTSIVASATYIDGENNEYTVGGRADLEVQATL